MKKLFGHTKRPIQPWSEYDYDESEYGWDGGDESPEDEIEYAGYADAEDMEVIEDIEDVEYAGTYADEDITYGEPDEDIAYSGSEEYAGGGSAYDEPKGYAGENDGYYESEEVEVYDADGYDSAAYAGSGEYEDEGGDAEECGEELYNDAEEYAGELYADAQEPDEAGGVCGEPEEYIEGSTAYYDREDYAGEDGAYPGRGNYTEDMEYTRDYADYTEGAEYAGEYGGYTEDAEYAGYSEGVEYAGEYGGYTEGAEYAGDYDGYSEGVEYAGDYSGYTGTEEYAGDYDNYMGEYADTEGYAAENAQGYADGEDEYDGPGDMYVPDGVNGGKKGFLAKLSGFLRNMDAMDKIMAVTGVGVLALAAVTGGVFFSSYVMRSQIDSFAEVGTQLEGITVIGEQGLMAVAEAEVARIMAASAPADGKDPVSAQEPDASRDYDEREYGRQVSVNPDFTSIQKDLKIKFINKKTDKLVANVPFSVMVTGPDGKTYIWSDDDMDGIIYKKDIAAGNYQVVMEALAEDKYSEYIIPLDTRSVTVKEEIAYVKVDVANEVKQETEVDVVHEDTKVNEVVVESVLQDTVPWVESKIINITYNEVAKSTIADPAAVALGKSFLRMSAGSAPSGSAASSSSSSAEESSSSSEESSESSSQGSPKEPSESSPGSSEEPSESSPGSSEEPSESSPGSSEEPSESSSPGTPEEPSESPDPVPGKVTAEPSSLTGAVGAKLAAKVTVSDFTEGGKMSYSVSSDNTAVATADIDSAGNISVTGVAAGKAKLTVTAKCEIMREGAQNAITTEATAAIDVTIADKLTVTLDKDAMTVYTDSPAAVNAAIVNAQAKDPALSAESSDTRVATVKVDKNVVTITGIASGSAVIVVKYTENGQEVKATCAVTVKEHPKNDKATKLKDLNGVQVYVLENNTYREASYADYYTADRFYVKGEVKYTGWQTIDGRLYYFNAEGEKVTGEQIIQGAKYNFAGDGSLAMATGEIGIDVSKWNGTIDWNAVKNSGISYVIIRCGYRGSQEGKLIEDSKYEANIKGATAAGLKVGIYFFSQAVDEVEAVEEASMVLALIKGYTISYPVFLDVETSGGRGDKIDAAARTAVCKAFCQTIQNANYTAGVYSNKTWLETKLDAGALGAYKIWLAQYAAVPTYNGRYDMWQYRSTGSVSGISGNVDMNICYYSPAG